MTATHPAVRAAFKKERTHTGEGGAHGGGKVGGGRGREDIRRFEKLGQRLLDDLA